MLFGLSYDYVGDLSETVALMWPAPTAPKRGAKRRRRRLSDVVDDARDARQERLPAQLARWLDALDETGRWALLKLVTGALRIGVSARLAKTAVAALGARTPTRSSWSGRAWRRPTPTCSPGSRAAASSPSRAIPRRSGR